MSRRVERLTENWRDHKLERKPNSACVVRYGGFGDMIQTSSILPLLSEKGYHVTLNTDDHGYNVIKYDPHINDFFLQRKNQVPVDDLKEYWDWLGSHYDKFVNLSESIEGRLLAIPGRKEHSLPKDERHELMNRNYLEETHSIAGLPFDFRSRFYQTKKEREWAEKTRRKILYGDKTPVLGGKIIMFSLSGSSVHKIWAYVDHVIAYLLLRYPDCRVVTVGDGLCEMLEVGWENEPRVFCKSGKWSIRETLAFLDECDLIIGTETGVLNAAGLLDVPKICILSHSTEENLTKHWKNTVALTPEDCPCYPCHQLHYGFKHCNRDEVTGMALCSSNIGPDRVQQAASYFLERNNERSRTHIS